MSLCLVVVLLFGSLLYGDLLHGATMITYEMRLAHKATYLMKEISVLPMPCSFEHLGLLLPMISSIMYINEMIESNQELIAVLKAEKSPHPYQQQGHWGLLQADYLLLPFCL
ncbi:hypothetical protein EDC96DRAFT_545179 [Choanephora cucurbitarum]|nr:hypothetical protein EDC96DRAFT_545179 [Choanephora cucurbitarum]